MIEGKVINWPGKIKVDDALKHRCLAGMVFCVSNRGNNLRGWWGTAVSKPLTLSVPNIILMYLPTAGDDRSLTKMDVQKTIFTKVNIPRSPSGGRGVGCIPDMESTVNSH